MERREPVRRVLNDDFVENLSPNRARRLHILDKTLSGLVLRVTESGAKSFSYRYKLPGAGVGKTGRRLKSGDLRVTLGAWPVMRVEQARDKVRELQKRVAIGVDPREEERQRAALLYGNTVEAVTKRMVEDAKSEIKTWAKMEQVLKDYVWPTIGARPVAEITTAEITALLDRIKVKPPGKRKKLKAPKAAAAVAKGKKAPPPPGIAKARETRKQLSRLFGYAQSKGLIKPEQHPMRGLRDKSLKQVANTRHLNDAELRAAWIATGELPYPYGPAFRLLLLTGQRLREWLHAIWPAIDAKERALTVPENKSGVEHLVPLCDITWAIVEQLPRYNSTDELFVTDKSREKNGKKKDLAVADSSSDAIDKMNEIALRVLREKDPKAELQRFTPHDFRRTMVTRMNGMKVAFAAREAVLGHVKKRTDKNYDMHDYLDEKREALTLYAEHVKQVVARDAS